MDTLQHLSHISSLPVKLHFLRTAPVVEDVSTYADIENFDRQHSDCWQPTFVDGALEATGRSVNASTLVSTFSHTHNTQPRPTITITTTTTTHIRNHYTTTASTTHSLAITGRVTPTRLHAHITACIACDVRLTCRPDCIPSINTAHCQLHPHGSSHDATGCHHTDRLEHRHRQHRRC